MDVFQYVLLVVAGTLGGAVGFPAAGIALIVKDFHDRVTWEEHAGLWGKLRVTARWTNEHTRWGRMPETAAQGGALSGGVVAVLVPLLVGLHSIFLA